MTEPMSPERFVALAHAYGGIDRWPSALRTAGWHLAAADPACARALAQAEALDRTLDAWTVAAPTPALRQRMVAARRRSWMVRARLWWSAIGVGTVLAGAVAGLGAAVVIGPERVAPRLDASVFESAGEEG